MSTLMLLICDFADTGAGGTGGLLVWLNIVTVTKWHGSDTGLEPRSLARARTCLLTSVGGSVAAVTVSSSVSIECILGSASPVSGFV